MLLLQGVDLGLRKLHLENEEQGYSTALHLMRTVAAYFTEIKPGQGCNISFAHVEVDQMICVPVNSAWVIVDAAWEGLDPDLSITDTNGNCYKPSKIGSVIAINRDDLNLDDDGDIEFEIDLPSECIPVVAKSSEIEGSLEKLESSFKKKSRQCVAQRKKKRVRCSNRVLIAKADSNGDCWCHHHPCDSSIRFIDE